MSRTLCYVIIGYLSGSILYARVFEKLFHKENMIEGSRDRNPGTANAFMRGGFWCGVLTLCCDMGKGFIPVFFYHQGEMSQLGLALILAAPAIGHIFPLFHKGRGGKGIATTFGSLLGLLYILFTDITDYAAFLQNDRFLWSIFYYAMSYAGSIFSKAWFSVNYDSSRNTVCIK